MSAARRWLWPLVPFYGAALAAGDAVRAAGLAPSHHLRWPVISVGSVSAGGAGKTPLTIALARLLAGRGWCVDILSRGYRREGRGIAEVNPVLPDASRLFGDEPVLLAERSGVPVWVGNSRHAAGLAAEAAKHSTLAKETATAPCVHLLDDGMQHRALLRQFELVLVTIADLRDTLLPAGNLREALPALRRADAFAVREDELDEVAPRLHSLCGPEIPVWTIRRSLQFPSPLGVFGAGLRPLAFCGVARPEGYAAMLTAAGCGLVDTVVFPDHHRYEAHDLVTLKRLAEQTHASGLVTTEKDAVKLAPAMREQLEREVGPLMVTPLEVNFLYESPVVRTLEARLRSHKSAITAPGRPAA